MDTHSLIEIIVGAVVAAIVAVARLVPRGHNGGVTRTDLADVERRVLDRLGESEGRIRDDIQEANRLSDDRTKRALGKVGNIVAEATEGGHTPPRGRGGSMPGV